MCVHFFSSYNNRRLADFDVRPHPMPLLILLLRQVMDAGVAFGENAGKAVADLADSDAMSVVLSSGEVAVKGSVQAVQQLGAILESL
jgi:hypothetical protein